MTEKTGASAKRIWAESTPAAGTLADLYFMARGIDPPKPMPGCVRFAKPLKHPTEQYFPALVIQATDARTGKPTGGIQRVFLAWDGKNKAQVDKGQQKLSLGPMKGGVARLAEPIDGKPPIIGEGIETVLTPMQAVDLPGWATFGTSGLAAFSPPDDVKHVIALAENDGGPNNKALSKMIPQLKERGIRVDVVKPPPGLKDFNDFVNGKSGHTPEAGRAAIKKMIEEALAGGEGDLGPSDSPGDVRGRKSQASVIVDIVKEECSLFHDSARAPYAIFSAPHEGGSHHETHKLRSKSFKLWLSRAYYRRTGSALNSDAISSALSVLEAFALFDGPTREVFVRRARHDGKIYIDICDTRWRAYEIDVKGWRIIDSPPVCFIRSSGMLPLPEANLGDSKEGMAKLRGLCRVANDADFKILVGFLLAALGGQPPYTAVIFSGEPGATKSTHAKIVRAIVDPNAIPLRSPPKELRDVYIAAVKSAVLAFNNLSFIPNWLSDALCVVTEGSGDSRRELYSDDEESVIFACAPVILTAVENVISRGDLSDRTLYVTLSAVPANERKDEAEMSEEIRKALPDILGALLTSLSTGIRREPTIRPERLPRMASFAKFVTACETALWEEGGFLEAYKVNSDSVAEDVLDSDKAVSAFREFMKDREKWVGTATALLQELVDHVKRPEKQAEKAHKDAIDDHDKAVKLAALKEAQDRSRATLAKPWPLRANVLSGRLKRFGPQLRRVGLSIEWPSGHHCGRILGATNSACPHTQGDESDSASPSSPSSPGKTANNKYNDIRNFGFGIGDDVIEMGDGPWSVRDHDPPLNSASGDGGNTQWDDVGTMNGDSIVPDNSLKTNRNSDALGNGDAGDANFRLPEGQVYPDGVDRGDRKPRPKRTMEI
jgi:hypothetical protein